MQHEGDLEITTFHEQIGQVTGLTVVKRGGHLVCHGQLAGGLIVEEGGKATIHGQVARNVLNRGELFLHGQITGRVIGNQPVNALGPNQIVGINLEVPFKGTTTSFSSSFKL